MKGRREPDRGERLMVMRRANPLVALGAAAIPPPFCPDDGNLSIARDAPQASLEMHRRCSSRRARHPAVLHPRRTRPGHRAAEGPRHRSPAIAAIHRATTGPIALKPQVVAPMLTPAQQAAADPLPHKERHLLTLIVEGHSNEAMAYHASVSERTVDSHVPMSPRRQSRDSVARPRHPVVAHAGRERTDGGPRERFVTAVQ